jgi:hypothetical protein
MAKATAMLKTTTTRGAKGKSGQAARERPDGVVPVADPTVGERELTWASYGKPRRDDRIARDEGTKRALEHGAIRRVHEPVARSLLSSEKLLRADGRHESAIGNGSE